MTGTAVARLAEFATTVAGDPPEEVLHDAKLRLLDTVGISVAALGTGPADVAHALVSRWGGTPIAGAIGLPQRLPAPSAALVNGTLAHALDFDDTHVPSILHPSASIVPAALAAAEEAGASGAALHQRDRGRQRDRDPAGHAGYDPHDQQLGLLRARPARHLDLRSDRLGRRGRRAAAGCPTSRSPTPWRSPPAMGGGLLEANRAGGGQADALRLGRPCRGRRRPVGQPPD